MNRRLILAIAVAEMIRHVGVCAAADQPSEGRDSWCVARPSVRQRLDRAIAELEQAADLLDIASGEPRGARMHVIAREMRQLATGEIEPDWRPTPELHVLGTFIGEPYPFSELRQSARRPAVRRVQDIYVKVTHRGAPVVVALLSEYPWVRWNFTLAEGAEVAQVVLSEEQPSTFTGLPLHTPTVREWRMLEPNSLGWYTETDLSRPAPAVERALRAMTALDPTSYQEFASDTLTSHSFTIGPECENWRLQYALARYREDIAEARALLFRGQTRDQLSAIPAIVGAGARQMVLRFDGDSTGFKLPSDVHLSAITAGPSDVTRYGTDGSKLYRIELSSGHIQKIDLASAFTSGDEIAGIAYDPRRRRVLITSLNRPGYFFAYSEDDGQWSNGGWSGGFDAALKALQLEAVKLAEMLRRDEFPREYPKPDDAMQALVSALGSPNIRLKGLAYSPTKDRLYSLKVDENGFFAGIVTWDAERLVPIPSQERIEGPPRSVFPVKGPVQLGTVGYAVAIATSADAAESDPGAQQVTVVDSGSNEVFASWKLTLPRDSSESIAPCGSASATRDASYVGWNGSWTVHAYDRERSRWLTSTAPRSERYAALTAIGDRLVAILDRNHAYAGWVFDRGTCAWTVIPEAPIPGRADVLGAWLEDQLVVWNTARPEELAVFDSHSFSWRVASERPPIGPRTFCRAHLAAGKRLYVWGGVDPGRAECLSEASSSHVVRRWYSQSTHALDDGAVFDVDTMLWEPLPRAPFPLRADAASGRWDEALVIVQDDSVALFDPRDATKAAWELLRLPGRVCMPAVAGAGSRLLVWSQCDAKSDDFRYAPTPMPSGATVYVYEREPGTWETLPTPPLLERWNPHITLWKDEAAIFGGWEPGSQKSIRDGASYDFVGNAWRSFARPPSLEPSEVARLHAPPTCVPRPNSEFELDMDL